MRPFGCHVTRGSQCRLARSRAEAASRVDRQINHARGGGPQNRPRRHGRGSEPRVGLRQPFGLLATLDPLAAVAQPRQHGRPLVDRVHCCIVRQHAQPLWPCLDGGGGPAHRGLDIGRSGWSCRYDGSGLVADWENGDREMAAVAEVIASAFASGMSWAGTIEGHPLSPPTVAFTGNKVMRILESFIADHPETADKIYGFALSASLRPAVPRGPGEGGQFDAKQTIFAK